MKHSPEFEALVGEARPRVKEIPVEEVAARLGSVRVIDVREDDEFRAAHIQGAEHIGKGVIERDIVQKAPDKSEELILYCGGGYRSVLAADAIQKMGYRNVRSMAGGWREWTAKNFPTEE